MTDPQVAEATRTFAAAVGQALGRLVVGVYVTGSATTDAFDWNSSDIDLFVVLERPPSSTDLAEIEALHARLNERFEWARLLEVDYAGRGQLREYGIDDDVVSRSPKRGLRLGPSAAGADDILGVREFGRALVGPAPASVFPQVSTTAFQASTVAYLDDLFGRPRSRPAADDDERAEWIVNIARCCHRLATGRLAPKPEACAWLSEQDQALAPILSDAVAGAAGDREAAARSRSAFEQLAWRVQVLRSEGVLKEHGSRACAPHDEIIGD